MFGRGLDDKEGKKTEFVKGLSEFILGKFYLSLQKQYQKIGSKIPHDLKKKLKAVFKVIKNCQKDDDMF